MIDEHFAYVILLGRLEGLLAGVFEPDWPGECFMLLGAVWGAAS